MNTATATAPPRLKEGAHLRVIAPARSMNLPWIRAVVTDAIAGIQEVGFRVSFADNIEFADEFDSSPVNIRLDALHQAYRDSTVDGILSLIGGFNSNELLGRLDYQLVAEHPKVLCGYSDITALTHAIYTKTNIITYSGPHFFSFGDRGGSAYTKQYFKQCVTTSEPFRVYHSDKWSDDLWAADQNNRNFRINHGPHVLREGHAEGHCIGGNLKTLVMLNGTGYRPSLEGAVLFLEDTKEVRPRAFAALLQALALQKDFAGIKALLFGRFCPDSCNSMDLLAEILSRLPFSLDIPIVANLDFGHTYPFFTFPIGGSAQVNADQKQFKLTITRH